MHFDRVALWHVHFLTTISVMSILWCSRFSEILFPKKWPVSGENHVLFPDVSICTNTTACLTTMYYPYYRHTMRIKRSEAPGSWFNNSLISRSSRLNSIFYIFISVNIFSSQMYSKGFGEAEKKKQGRYILLGFI